MEPEQMWETGKLMGDLTERHGEGYAAILREAGQLAKTLSNIANKPDADLQRGELILQGREDAAVELLKMQGWPHQQAVNGVRGHTFDMARAIQADSNRTEDRPTAGDC